MILDPMILIYVAGGLSVLLIAWIIRLEIKLKRLLLGKNARSLEDSIVSIGKELESFRVFRKEIERYLHTVEMRLKRSVQSIDTIRFNPFKGDGSGGNQSFASAFLNEHGDGVVISSMYGRDRMSIFAKPLKNFASEYELSEEEKKSISDARAALSRK